MERSSNVLLQEVWPSLPSKKNCLQVESQGALMYLCLTEAIFVLSKCGRLVSKNLKLTFGVILKKLLQLRVLEIISCIINHYDCVIIWLKMSVLLRWYGINFLFCSLYELTYSEIPIIKIKFFGKGMHCNAKLNMLYVFILVISQGFLSNI